SIGPAKNVIAVSALVIEQNILENLDGLRHQRHDVHVVGLVDARRDDEQPLLEIHIAAPARGPLPRATSGQQHEPECRAEGVTERTSALPGQASLFQGENTLLRSLLGKVVLHASGGIVGALEQALANTPFDHLAQNSKRTASGLLAASRPVPTPLP